jgi:hypothetical protein
MTEFSNMGSITNLKENKTVFIPCECENEILMVKYDHEWKMAEISIYEHIGFRNKLSLWQKIRYVCRILWYGYPYGDQIVLVPKQLKELKSFLGSLDL